MTKSDAFGRFHPLVCFAYFAFAIVVCVMLRHPAFQLVSLLCAIACYLSVGGALKTRTLAYFVAVFVFVSLLNPVFNTMGDTLIFAYFGGRPFTLEALAFGVSSALMLAGMMVWFFSFNLVVDSEKMTYLLGGLAPAVSLILVMALRLIPQYRVKLNDFSLARQGLHGGETMQEDSRLRDVKEALLHLSMLLTWAFEGAVQTADSMRSRAYGSQGKRSHYQAYCFELRDGVLLVIMILLGAVVLYACSSGFAAAEYLPAMSFAPLEGFAAFALVAYAVFLSIPLLVNMGEELSWRISLSRI